MYIQLALDRLSIEEAIDKTRQVSEFVDWIEVGTSLIKEFGMESIRRLRAAFPEKSILADMKTIDNAKYEWEMCFDAGADIATVMAASPRVTVETCLAIARRRGKLAMLDLLNAAGQQVLGLSEYKEAIFCVHVSKDQQEAEKTTQTTSYLPEGIHAAAGYNIAVAGGISLESLPLILKAKPHVLIIGSAITGADQPRDAAERIRNSVIQADPLGGK